MVRELIANFDRWSRLMNRWGFAPNGKTFDALVMQYSENGRHYHGLEHVSACLRHFDSLAHQLDHDREVELALWFHDAIYQALAADNERQSADWVARFMADNGAGEVEIARVHQLVMATEHRTVAQGHDESILVDIDLAILGAAPDEYDVFEQNVRAEYWMVPEPDYRQKRTAVLRGFLQRSQIYQTAAFSVERERQARKNLAGAIDRLADGVST